MARPINLRFDLRHLSDDELARRIADAMRDQEAADRWRGWWFPGLIHGRRGPIRHPRCYRFIGALSAGDGGLLTGLVACLLSSKSFERLLRMSSAAKSHISLCELQDLVEEAQRRIAKRGGKAVTVQ